MSRSARTSLVAVVLALSIGLTGLASAGAVSATVTVRIEGATHTLLPRTRVPLTDRVVGLASSCGPIRPCTLCPGSSGLGALDGATSGRWRGPAFPEHDYGTNEFGYDVTTILGETHRSDQGAGRWAGYINDHFMGVFCEAGLRPGDSVVFFPHLTPDTWPLGLVAPRHVSDRGTFAVTVVKFDFDGTPTPVADALVRGGKRPARTNAAGRARVRPGEKRRLRLQAFKHGLVRTDVRPVVVRPSRAD